MVGSREEEEVVGEEPLEFICVDEPFDLPVQVILGLHVIHGAGDTWISYTLSAGEGKREREREMTVGASIYSERVRRNYQNDESESMHALWLHMIDILSSLHLIILGQICLESNKLLSTIATLKSQLDS